MQVTSPCSVPSPAPLLGNPLGMMKFGLSTLGEGWQSQTRNWQAVLTACCQLQGLLTACSHHPQCSHQDTTTTATTAEKCCPFHPHLGTSRETGSPREVSPAAIFTIQENILVSSLPPGPYNSAEHVRTQLFPYCPRAGPAGGVGTKGVKA